MFPDIAGMVRGLMPELVGELESNKALARYTRFKVGGPAQLFFSPKDENDLAYFLSRLPAEIDVRVIGLGSNLLIRDGGLEGVVIHLKRHGFGELRYMGDGHFTAGAAVPDGKLAKLATDHDIDGFGFLTGIPGNIGGAIRSNAGADGSQLSSIFVEVKGIDRGGNRRVLTKDVMGFDYRTSRFPAGMVFTEVKLFGASGDRDSILASIRKYDDIRRAKTPFQAKTAGSTFKNPEGYTAGHLIDRCGFKGYKLGSAQISELHANYLINLGGATASELEELGEQVREQVKSRTGITLEWEVERIGRPI
jgi:UDP-N-acetylmuramate dehydrogenase